jgi:hypothetical protein
MSGRLPGRVAADGRADDVDEIVPSEVGGRQPVLGVVGVDRIREAVSEQNPVALVDRDRIADDPVTDQNSVLESADPGLEVEGHKPHTPSCPRSLPQLAP